MKTSTCLASKALNLFLIKSSLISEKVLKIKMIPLLLLFTSFCSGANPIDLNLNQALNAAVHQEQNIFVYFNAKWCLPCQIAKDGVLADSKIKSALNDGYVNVDVDIDNPNQNDWSKGYASSCLPHFLILDKDGLILKEIAGTLPIEAFYSMLLQFSKPNKYAIVKAENPAPKKAKVI